jgi:hypothetical protein
MSRDWPVKAKDRWNASTKTRLLQADIVRRRRRELSVQVPRSLRVEPVLF